MRRPSLLRILVTAVLILWTPWCFCGLRAMAEAPREERPAATTSCCSHCCASEDDGTPADDSTPETPCAPGDHCGAACCHPRTPALVPPTTLPFDTVGLTFAFTFEWRERPLAATWNDTRTWTWPPGSVGRAVLLQSSVLRT
ncbi:MAG: hypothetical protein JNM94_12930 [Phycisphaerae bacterium]|nr:hypothetical protein [Phycisphaerae bacterium]